MAQQLIIANTHIPCDSDQRINLNALHRASGLGKTKQPNNWLRLDTTKELIAELSQSSNLRIGLISKIRGGNKSGTFAHELLAISYAGWISPQFQLEVNRVFLASKQPRQLPSPTVSHDLSLNDLIYELAKAKHVTTQNIHSHYNSVFNTNAWSQAQGFDHALAKRILKQDLANALRTQSPQLDHLIQQAKQHGLTLIDEQEYQGFQGRMQMQQQQIDKLADDVMALSRNHNALMSQVW